MNATDSFSNVAAAKTIVVTANGAPVIAVPGAQTIGVGQLAAISGISVSETGTTTPRKPQVPVTLTTWGKLHQLYR